VSSLLRTTSQSQLPSQAAAAAPNPNAHHGDPAASALKTATQRSASPTRAPAAAPSGERTVTTGNTPDARPRTASPAVDEGQAEKHYQEAMQKIFFADQQYKNRKESIEISCKFGYTSKEDKEAQLKIETATLKYQEKIIEDSITNTCGITAEEWQVQVTQRAFVVKKTGVLNSEKRLGQKPSFEFPPHLEELRTRMGISDASAQAAAPAVSSSGLRQDQLPGAAALPSAAPNRLTAWSVEAEQARKSESGE
jgi:hypothetical protein